MLSHLGVIKCHEDVLISTVEIHSQQLGYIAQMSLEYSKLIKIRGAEIHWHLNALTAVMTLNNNLYFYCRFSPSIIVLKSVGAF